MAEFASNEYLVQLRHREHQLPVTAAALEKHISELLEAQFQKYHLPEISIALLEEPPLHHIKSFGWFSFLRAKKRPVAIFFNLQLFDGLTIAEIEDIALHELCHYLVFQRFPDLQEDNDGHGKVFYDTCREIGCKPESDATRRNVRRMCQRRIEHSLTSAKEAFLSGDLAAAKSISFEASSDGMMGKNLPFEAFLNYYQGDTTQLLACLEAMRDYIEEDMQAEALFAWLSLKVCQDDEAWGYFMQLKRASLMSVLAQYFYGKSLIEGAFGVESSPKMGLRYLQKAMRPHFPPAIRFWKETLLKTQDCPDMQKMAALIDLDIGQCPLDLVPGEDCACFVPFL